MPDIHDRARQLATERQIPIAEAYSELGRRAAASRRRNAKHGRLRQQLSAQDLESIEQPKIRLPYSDN